MYIVSHKEIYGYMMGIDLLGHVILLSIGKQSDIPPASKRTLTSLPKKSCSFD